MNFERTSEGLSNTHLFYGVELLVLTEGKEQAAQGDLGSLDLLFWSNVINSYAPNRSSRIVCRGSKTNLLNIANRVSTGEVENVVVAMDRDWDIELKRSIKHPSVLYTYGYSWENDVWNLESVLSLLRCKRPVPPSIGLH